MAGNFIEKEFVVRPEEQTLLKEPNGTRIIPTKGKSLFNCTF